MLRATLLAVTVLFVAPAGAAAAIGQVEPLTVRGYDDCVQATGRPGELAMPATDGVRFVQATREGLKAGPALAAREALRVRLGRVAGQRRGRDRGGAARRERGRRERSRAGRRSVGRARDDRAGSGVAGGRRARRRLGPRRRDRELARVAVRSQPGSIRRVRVARRSPGGAFGAAEPLGEVAKRHELVLPAVAGTGEAFVLTTTAADTGTPSHVPLRVWTAAPGAAFGAPGTVGSMRREHAPALAAAADGRVLVAWSDGASLHVTEREPGGRFAAPVRLGDADERPGFAAGVTVGPAGEAAVGWVQFGRGEAQIASRRAPGAFGPPTRIARRRGARGQTAMRSSPARPSRTCTSAAGP